MNKHFNPAISEEKFAAWLDGMLPQDEMMQVSQLVEFDDTLHQLSTVSSAIDNAVAGFANADIHIPTELSSAAFEIPTIPNGMISPLITLSPDPTDELLVAAACADEDMSMFSNNSQDENLSIESDAQDNLTHKVPDSGNFGSNDDMSGTFSDDL